MDIDDRAAQLAYFAVMMKARQYDRRFFSRGIQPHVYAIVESNHVDKFAVDYFCNGDAKLKEAMDTIISELHDAKEYGSILTVTPQDWPALYDRFAEIKEDIHISREAALRELLPLVQVAEALAQKYDTVVTNPPYMGGRNMNEKLLNKIVKDYPSGKADLFSAFILRTSYMTKKNCYTSMITQHSWMFLSSFEALRKEFLNTNLINMCHLGPRAFEEISGEVVQTTTWISRKSNLQGLKGSYVRLVNYDSQNEKEQRYLEGEAPRYSVAQSQFDNIPGRAFAYWLGNPNVFIQGKLLEQVANPRQGMKTLDNDYYIHFWCEVSHDNIMFTAVDSQEAKLTGRKWFPINHGGEYRKYYGNNYNVVNWYNDGAEMKANAIRKYNSITRTITNMAYYFKPGITWSVICSYPSFRWYGSGFLFSNGGQCVVPDTDEELDYIIGILNSKVTGYLLNILSPTLGFESGYLKKIPIIQDSKQKVSVIRMARNNVELSKKDWDSYEISWDFQHHPLLCYGVSIYSGLGDMQLDGEYSSPIHVKYEKTSTSEKTFEVGALPNYRLETSFTMWKQACESRFQQLKANEEELNRIFIDIYGLQDELTPEVADKDITVHRIFDTKEDVPESMQGSNYVRTMRDEIVSLISYAVGCMFGRYSLDVDGLVYAGGDFDTKYCRWIRQFGDAANEEIDENGELIDGGWAGCTLWEYDGVRKGGKWVPASYPPDTDNIIPISDDEYFEDDIVGRFVEFVRIVYGTETLDENLQFIADALGGKGTPKEVIRNYFLTKFYADHCKIYQKRPIYWLFDSGKKNGFKCLIYMHRYQPDTIARIRTDYVHEQQARYRTAIADLEQRIANAATGERVKLNKQLKKLNDQAAEILAYEEKIHHLADQMIPIDLDDGVKVNYAKFQDVLAKIK